MGGGASCSGKGKLSLHTRRSLLSSFLLLSAFLFSWEPLLNKKEKHNWTVRETVKKHTALKAKISSKKSDTNDERNKSSEKWRFQPFWCCYYPGQCYPKQRSILMVGITCSSGRNNKAENWHDWINEGIQAWEQRSCKGMKEVERILRSVSLHSFPSILAYVHLYMRPSNLER